MIESSKPRLQLKHLFWGTALIAAGLGVSIGTLFWTALVIVYWVLKFNRVPGRNVLLVFVLLCFFGGLLLPAVAQVRDAARRTVCMNNMRQILLAILTYESAHGHLPRDTSTVNDKGETIRASWRAHIMPFMEMDSSGFRYRFDEPWDSANNAAMQTRFSDWTFQCPSHQTGSKTPYKLVAGKGTAFEVNGKVAFNECVDGADFTVALVEDIQNPVEYFKPEDLSVDEAIELFNNTSKKHAAHIRDHFFSIEYVGFHFASLDGSLHRWPVNPKGQVDERAFLIADGKPDNLDVDGRKLREMKWSRVISLVVYIGLCFWPLVWLRKKEGLPAKTHDGQ